MTTLKARITNHKIMVQEQDDSWTPIHSNHSIPTTLDEVNYPHTKKMCGLPAQRIT